MNKRSQGGKQAAKKNPWIAHVKQMWVDDGSPTGQYMEYVKRHDIKAEYYDIKQSHNMDYMRHYFWLWSPYIAAEYV